MLSLHLNRNPDADALDAALDRLAARDFKIAQAIAPALDAIMATRSQPGYHKHICPCGDFYVCSQDPDHCERDWTCPSCLERQMDEFAGGDK